MRITTFREYCFSMQNMRGTLADILNKASCIHLNNWLAFLKQDSKQSIFRRRHKACMSPVIIFFRLEVKG